MKGIVSLATLAVVCCATATMGADVSLRVTCTTPSPGPNDTVGFIIEGNASTGDNQGLALFGLDVTVTGPTVIDHDLDMTIAAPTGSIATYFVNPGGLTNPAGFGGTPTGPADSLMQVGGAANTINNTSPPAAPTAWPVPTGMAQGAWTTLAEGSIALSGATDGIHTITLSDAFANVLITLHATPNYWEVAQASIVDGGMSDTFTVSSVVVPPVIDAVASLVTHGGTERPLAMYELPFGEPSEPRLAGVEKVEVTFEAALDPATVVFGNVAIRDSLGNPVGATVAVTPSAGDTVVTIDITSGALANAECYTFDLNGMQSVEGDDFVAPEDGQFQIIALVGDVDRDAVVSTADNSSVKSRLGMTAPACP